MLSSLFNVTRYLASRGDTSPTADDVDEAEAAPAPEGKRHRSLPPEEPASESLQPNDFHTDVHHYVNTDSFGVAHNAARWSLDHRHTKRVMSLDESRLGGKKSLSSFERSLKCSLDARSNGVIDALPVGRRTAVMGAVHRSRRSRDEAPPILPKSPKSRAIIKESMSKNPLFKMVSASAQDAAVDAMSMLQAPAGTVLITQHEAGDKFFVLESGVCDVYVSYSPKANEYSNARESLDVKPPSSSFGRGARMSRDSMSRDSMDVIYERGGGGGDPYMNVVATPGLHEKLGKRLPAKRFEAGTSFGEVALLYSSARTASVVTATACTLWVLHRSHYSTIKRRFALTHHKEKLSLLESLPMFEFFSEYHKDTLVEALEHREFREGDYLLRRGGSTGETVMVIKTGEVAVRGGDNDVVDRSSPSPSPSPSSRDLGIGEHRRLHRGTFIGRMRRWEEGAAVSSYDYVVVSRVAECYTITHSLFMTIFGSEVEHRFKLDQLRSVPVLRHFTDEELAYVAEHMETLEVKEGEFLYQAGDRRDKIFTVASSDSLVSDSLDSPVARNNTLVQNLSNSNMLSYLDVEGTDISMPDDISVPDANNATQTSSLQIPGGAKVACLSQSTLRECLTHVQNLQWAWRADRLNALDIARPLTYEQRLEIAKAMKVLTFEAGDVICDAGDHSDSFSVLQRGKVVLEGTNQTCRVFSKGDAIGEWAHGTTDGRLVANSNVQVLRCSRSSLVRILGNVEEYFGAAETPKATELGRLQRVGILGTGSFGLVRLCRDVDTDRHYALKCMNKRKLQCNSMMAHLLEEKQAMANANSPFVVPLVQTMQDEENLYILAEPIMGGEFFSHLCMDGPFVEADARFYAACAIEALAALHANGCVYRDLKPENLMVSEHNGYLKLSDLGFTKRIVNSRTFTMCGTPDYMAPEVIAECGHQYSVDWWGLGVLIYEMTTLERPFTEGDQMQTIVNIVNYTPNWAPAEHVSPQCRDLIMRLLTYNSVLRLGSLGGAQDVRDHPWFAGFDWQALQEQRMTAPMVPETDGPADLRFFQEYHSDVQMPDHPNGAYDDAQIVHDESLFKDW